MVRRPEPTSRAQPLYGRERALAVATKLLDTMSSGRGAALLVEGEAGIGRTALLRAVAGMAEMAGYTVAHAEADVLEQSFPLGAVRPLFDVLVSRDAASRDAASGDAASGDAEAWRPDGPDAAGTDLYPFFERWYRTATHVAARTPLLIVVDDLHWCDDLSLRWLAFLARRCWTAPIGVLAAVRTGEQADNALLIELVRRFRRLPLVGLDVGPTAQVVHDLVGAEADTAFIAACHRVTGGNPRLLDELLTEVASRAAPPTLHTAARIDEFTTPAMVHALLAEVNRGDPDATALAGAVAALDGRVELDLAARLADLDPAQAARAADALVRRRILRDTEPLTFAHPLLATAIARHMGVGVAGSVHARAARLLSQAGRDEVETAHHLMSASTIGEAWALLLVDVPAALDRLTAALREAEDQRILGRVVAELTALALTAGDGRAVELAHARSAPVAPTKHDGGSLVVQCFGGFHLDLLDRRLDWSVIRPRVRALLRFLAAHAGRPVHRELILAALWPELPSRAGIRNLHVGVSTLRTFLEPGIGRGESRFIRRDDESYLLAVPHDGQYDVRAFDEAVTSGRQALAAGRTGAAAGALRHALAQYSGDLLPEDGPAEWVVAERDRYRMTAAESAAMLARIEFDAGHSDAAIHAARRSVELDGFRDDAWHTLAEAYRSAGHTAAAEQALRAYEDILHSLGVGQPAAEASAGADGHTGRPLTAYKQPDHGRLKNSTSPKATRRSGAPA